MDGHGFFRVEYNGGGRIILKEPVEMVETVGEFRKALRLDDKPHYIIIDDRGIHSMSREARATFAKPNDTNTTGGAAVLIRSGISETIGNFIIKVCRPKYPSPLFITRRLQLHG